MGENNSRLDGNGNIYRVVMVGGGTHPPSGKLMFSFTMVILGNGFINDEPLNRLKGSMLKS